LFETWFQFFFGSAQSVNRFFANFSGRRGRVWDPDGAAGYGIRTARQGTESGRRGRVRNPDGGGRGGAADYSAFAGILRQSSARVFRAALPAARQFALPRVGGAAVLRE